jgi:outer membrane lipoprotein-sorting protein
MRFLTGIVASLVITGCAVAAEKPPAAPQPQPAPAAPPAAGGAAATAAGAPLNKDSTVDQILDALDAVGRNLKSFTADVTMKEEDVTLANESTRRGKVLFQERPDAQGAAGGGTRLRVVFEKREVGKRAFDERVEYLLQDGWLTDRTYDPKRIEVRRQVLRPGEKLNLLKLGEGPFPLPIGQKKESVHEQFDVKKPPAGKDDPAGTVHVRLAPKPGTRFAKKFDAIDVFVDAKTHLPVRIDSAQGETVRTTELKNFTINPTPPLTDADFALPKIDESKWSLHTEPFSE